MTPKGKTSTFILWHLEVAEDSSGRLLCLLGLGQVASLDLAQVNFSCICFLTNVHLLWRAPVISSVYQPKEKEILTSSLSLLLPNTATSSSLELLVPCGEPGHPSGCWTQEIYPIHFWDHLCRNFASSSYLLCMHICVHTHTPPHTHPPTSNHFTGENQSHRDMSAKWLFISQVNDIKSFVSFLFFFLHMQM